MNFQEASHVSQHKTNRIAFGPPEICDDGGVLEENENKNTTR
jgi:hypothetical protein